MKSSTSKTGLRYRYEFVKKIVCVADVLLRIVDAVLEVGKEKTRSASYHNIISLRI